MSEMGEGGGESDTFACYVMHFQKGKNPIQDFLTWILLFLFVSYAVAYVK